MPGAGLGLTSPKISLTISANTTNATSVKASAGELKGYVFTNQHPTDWAFLKLYNKASAPTVGTDTPALILGLPPASSGHIDLRDHGGIAFGTGIAFALTADEAIADTTAVAASSIILNLLVD